MCWIDVIFVIFVVVSAFFIFGLGCWLYDVQEEVKSLKDRVYVLESELHCSQREIKKLKERRCCR